MDPRKHAGILVSIFVVAAVLGCVIMPPVKGDTIWESGVELGWPAEASWNGLWAVQVSSLSAHTGSRGVNVVGPSASAGDALWFGLSASGYQDLTWEYYYKIRDGLEVGDSVLSEWSSDNGETWLPLVTYTESAAGDWQLASFVLPASASNNSNLVFRFVATLGGSTDRMNFDDFKLSGVVTPEPITLLLFGLGVLIYHRRI